MTKELLIAEICNNREDAYEFVSLLLNHFHQIDDLIDSLERPAPKVIIEAFVNAAALLTHSFFTENKAKLYPVYILSAVAYNTSLEFESSNKDYLVNIGDHLRSFANQMLILIAGICSDADNNNFSRLCKISEEVHKLSYWKHHDALTGKPI